MGKHKYISFPEDYNVPEETEREYNRIVRHEEYLERKDREAIAVHYESEESLYVNPLMKNMQSGAESQREAENLKQERLQLLPAALEKLKEVNEISYSILMDYYFSCGKKVTLEMLAKKYNISITSVFRRIKRSHKLIRNAIYEMTDQEDSK